MKTKTEYMYLGCIVCIVLLKKRRRNNEEEVVLKKKTRMSWDEPVPLYKGNVYSKKLILSSYCSKYIDVKSFIVVEWRGVYQVTCFTRIKSQKVIFQNHISSYII